MSFIEDFWHHVPPDDYDGGGYSRRKSKTSYSSNYNNTSFNKVKMNVKKIIKETDKAYLLEFDQGEAWVPKSEVTLSQPSIVLTLPEWLKKSLEFKK